MSEQSKEYLGDSVYVDRWTPSGCVLTTENGGGPSNQIFLEPEVILALLHWLEQNQLNRIYSTQERQVK